MHETPATQDMEIPAVQNGLYENQNGRILQTLKVSVQDTTAPKPAKTKAIMLCEEKVGG